MPAIWRVSVRQVRLDVQAVQEEPEEEEPQEDDGKSGASTPKITRRTSANAKSSGMVTGDNAV